MGLQDGLCSGPCDIPYYWFETVGGGVDILSDSFKLRTDTFSPIDIIRVLRCKILSGEMLVNSQNIAGDNRFSELSSIKGL